jgi:hypothetical protein
MDWIDLAQDRDRLGYFLVGERLAASQEGLSSIKLVSLFMSGLLKESKGIKQRDRMKPVSKFKYLIFITLSCHLHFVTCFVAYLALFSTFSL